MRRHWTLIRADFAREYGIDDDTALLHMGWRLFVDRLAGLSPQAVFRLVANGEPQVISDPDEIQAVFDRM